MIHSTVIGRLWGEPEDRITTTGKSLVTLSLSYQDKVTRKYQYVKLCLWGDKFSKLVPYLKSGTTVFAQGTLLIDTYFSRNKGEVTVSLSMNVDSLQIIFNPNQVTNSDERKETESSNNTDGVSFEEKQVSKEKEEEDLDWGGAIFNN